MINENTSQGDDEMSQSENSPGLTQKQQQPPAFRQTREQLVPDDDLSSSSSDDDDDDDKLLEGGDPGSYSDGTSSSYQSQMEQSRVGYPAQGYYQQHPY